MTLQKVLLVMLLFLSFFLPHMAATAEETKPTVPDPTQNCVLLLNTAKVKYTVGESIMLNMTVENRGKKDVVFMQSWPLITFDIKVALPDGKAAPLTLYGTEQKNATAFIFGMTTTTLKPGDTVVVSLMINRYFDMSLDGDYKVAVSTRVVDSDDWKKRTPLSADLAVTLAESTR